MLLIPRLLLELEALADCVHEERYHAKLQGFVYSLLRGTPYENVHDRPSYKNFCFSNIFPVKLKDRAPETIKKGELKKLQISSPDAGLISAFASSLAKVERFNVGDMFFALRRVRITSPKIERGSALVTRTPIIIRIPKHSYEKYGIASEHPYVYWRKNLSFNAFLRQLEENLIKKYQEHQGAKLDESAYLPLFQQFLFKKQVCNHLVFNENGTKIKEFRVFGSLWEFTFDYLTKEQRALLQFGLDAGFGERNSLGFGFIDVKKHFPRDRERNI